MSLPRQSLSSFFSRPLPLLVFLAGLSVTYLLWTGERHNAAQDLQSRFDLQVQEVTGRISQRMRAYEQMLYATRALFPASTEVTREDFREYVASLSLQQNYPGVQGIAFAPLIKHRDKVAHIAAVRKEGYPDYDIKPEGEREFYAPVTYLEPFEGRNLRAFGYDRYSETIRRAALEQARDNDVTVLSGRLRLVIEDDQRPQFGCLMNLPLYKRGAPHETLSERRANLLGWVTATYRMDDLMAGILGQLNSGLDIEVYDGDQIGADTLMHDYDGIPSYANQTSLFKRTQALQISGHTWTVLMRSLPEFDAQLDLQRSRSILLIGIPLSLILSIMAWLLLRSRSEAMLVNRELESSEARLRATLDNSPYMIWQKDVEGRYIVCNQAFFNATGKSTPEEVIGQTDFDIWPQDLAEKYRADDYAVMQSNKQKSIEELNGTGEQRFWVETCKTPILDKQGELLGTSGFAQDITQRKLAEETIRQSEARFRQIFNGGSDAIYVVDPVRNCFIEANDIACQRLGYSHDELLRLGVADINEPESLESMPAIQEQLRETGHAMFERVHLAKDGRRIPVEISAHLMQYDGKPTILSLARDISERKQAESEFKTILQTTADGFWLVSTQTGLIVDVNLAYCGMSGYRREELLNQSITLVEAEQDQEKIARNIQIIMSGDPLLFETRHRHKDGHLIDVEVSARFMNARGGMIVTFIRDITERKRAEQALVIQQERLNEAQHIAHVGSWELNLADNKLDWSDEIFRIFEVDPERFGASYEAFLERIHPDDRDRVNAAFTASVEQRMSYEIVHRLLMADGRIKHVQERGYSVYDEQGAPLRSMGTVQDITERMQIEEALKQSQERLAIATRAGIIGVWDWDVANNQLVWDEAMYRLYGIRAEDFSGAYEAWSSVIHPEDKARAEADIQAALRGEREYAPEFRVIWPGGSIHHLKAASHTEFDEQGKPLRMVGINYDQTEQKQAEQKIAGLLELNNKIISQSTLGIAVYKEDGECAVYNEAAAHIIGSTPERELQRNFRQLPSWQTYGLLDVAQRVLDSGESDHVESHMVTSYGKDLWLSLDFVRLSSGNEKLLLLIFSDVSPFRLAEQALTTAKAEAENANRAKSEFLANMSHEIRTPMNAIIGLSDLALGGADLTPKLHNYLNKIHTSSKALLSIINDILDYSKVEAGRLELDSTEFCLGDLLENVADLFNVRAEEKGIELVLDIAPDVPEHVLGDSLRIGQVMNNLVGNAVKFTEHGEIVVRVEQLELKDGVSTLHFTVRDTGIGMSAEQAARLFHAFTQADSSITRRFGGTGLGLTISQKLVEKMGGKITVTSEPDKGSTFGFTIALSVSTQAHIDRSPPGLRGMRVLVVDDLDISRLSLRELLKAWRFEVSEAASGQEALALIEQHASQPEQAFELVLLDWKMPGMSGVDVARKIKEMAQNNAAITLPVIIMVTAYSKDQVLQDAHDLRLDAILNKPVTSSGLFDTIVRFQGGHVHRAYDPQASAELSTDAAAIRGARILLVEDNDINQLVAKDLLERMGLDVTVANNGREALEHLDQASFDAVLMDLQMPEMDGFEATRRIRSETRWHDLPVIAMTAAVMAEDRAACTLAGMNDHVAKPILPQELVHTLLHWIAPKASSGQPLPTSGASIMPDIRLPESMPGFDLSAALGLLGGNRLLLLELLKKFAQQFGDARQELAKLLAGGDSTAANVFAHRIKGAAANLGAMELHHAADELERKLKAGAIQIDSQGFDEALAQTMDSIARLGKLTQVIPIALEYDCKKCDWQRATALVGQIRALVDSYEFVPFELIAETKAAVACGPFRERLDELERQLDKTDYDKAMKTLENIPCIEGHNFNG